MSQQDLLAALGVATIIVGTAALFFAVIAAWASVYAIRRDRAALRVRRGDGAAGTFFMVVSNVGLRPVRITDVLLRPSRWRRWLPPVVLPTPFVEYLPDHPDPDEYPPPSDSRRRRQGAFPFVLGPAGEVVIAIPTPVLGAYHGVGVEDASGRRHWLREQRPPGRRGFVDVGAVIPDGRQHMIGDAAPEPDTTLTG